MVHSTAKNAGSEYRPDIDGLRAVAVLLVVAFHAFPSYLPGGFIGVDIFFVISGFLISGIIFKNLDQGSFSFAEFYRRRIRRIFPALLIVLLACLAFGWLVLWPDEYEQLARQTAAGAAFSSNILFWNESGYFDSSSDRKPLLHLWSLGIEEQFYLIWPACLALLWKRKQSVPWIVALLALLSFAANALFVGEYRSATFYLPFTRFWELLAGCLLAYRSLFLGDPGSAPSRMRPHRFDGARPAVDEACAITGSLLIATALVLLHRDRAFPGWWALLPAAGSVLLIAGGPHAWINRTLLRHPAMVLVGLISYPLYLWHWPLLAFARTLTKPGPAFKLALVLASFLLAWATWKYVEGTARARATHIGPRADIVPLLAGLAFCCLLGVCVVASDGVPRRISSTDQAALHDVATPVIERDYLPGPPRFASLRFNRQSKPGRVDAVVLGDSHALSLFPGLAAADPQRTWLLLGTPGCPPVLDLAVHSDSMSCPDMRQTFDALEGLERLPLVVLAFYGYYAETTDEPVNGLLRPSVFRLNEAADARGKEEALFAGLANSVGALLKRGKRTVLMIDEPELPFFPRDCVKRPLFSQPATCSVDRASVDERQRGLRSIVQRLQRRFPSLEVFDPLPLLCGNSHCNPVSSGLSYYSDNNHLSLRGSQTIARALLAKIDVSRR